MSLTIGLLAAALGGQPSPAQPVWLAAHEVKVRPAGQPDFKAAGRVGVEFFRDPPAGAVLAVSDKGQLAAVTAGDPAGEKKLGWLFALDLKARTPDQEQFDQAKAFGVEGYKDQHTGKLVYLTQAGGVALADPPAAALTQKPAKFHHALTLKARAATEDAVSEKTKRVGVEVYQDENTGGLVYVTDAGFIAAAPAPAAGKAADAGKKPALLYGLPLRVRKPDESAYTDATPRIGVEVYRDGATGHLIYVTEAGGIAVVPHAGGVDKGKGYTEERGLLLVARPTGETRFEKGTRLGVEVVRDNNSGHTIYLASTGAIAVLPAKK